MNKLVIVTGVSGTGKSSLSKTLYKNLENSSFLSYDQLSESIYDIVGFNNKEQKKNLQLLNKDLYKKLIETCMERQDEIVILEKPFDKEWKNFFQEVSQKYQYEIFTINLFAKDFETIWNRLLKREKSKQDRHPSHYLDSYCFKQKENYEPFFEYHYDTFKEEYDNLLSNSINLGRVINIEDIETIDIKDVVNKLVD